MDQKTKTKPARYLLFFSTVFLFLFFGINIKPAEAKTCQCKKAIEPGSVAQGIDVPIKSLAFEDIGPPKDFNDPRECITYCEGLKADDMDFAGKQTSLTAAKNYSAKSAEDVCKGLDFWNIGIGSVFNCILLYFLKFEGKLLAMAATLFAVVVSPESLQSIINNSGVYTAWVLVRDALNVAFILVLLFSAFCTVFQVEKYNYRALLRNLIIMALLVNFSYPITRVIIDFSNSMMYYFLNSSIFNGLSGEGIMVHFTRESAINGIITPKDGVNADTSFLLSGIVFLFILAITLLAIGVLLVIRAVMLAVLIIFSSVGFVGTIIPFLSDYSSKFWKNLFNYSFFGPAMVFMLAIAIQMMANLGVAGESFGKIASNQSSTPDIVATMAFFSIPIVILWVGIGTAQTMGIAGAAMVTKGGMGLGKKISGYNWGKKNVDQFRAARKARADEINKGRFGGKFGNWVNRKQDTVVGALGGRAAEKRVENMRRAKAAKTLREKAADLKGSKIEDLSVEVNNSFDMAGNLDPSKVTETSAGSAQAFMDKNADDRKTFVETTLIASGGIAGSKLENLFASLPAGHPILADAAAVASGNFSADQLRRVTAYINRKSEEVVSHYTK